ncbi:MAG: acyltransferase [Clostridia bacterium]|nr:acyltransferase [Clostridia bacterium]
MNKRKYELSFLNVVFCLLVIFIHTVSNLLSSLDTQTNIYSLVLLPWRLSSFVVQGFIFLSGLKMFLSKSDTFSYPAYLYKRFKSIIIPYIVWFIIYYVFFIFFLDYPFDIKFIFTNFITGNLVYHLYFVVIIAQFYILAPLWRLIINKLSAKIVIPVSFVLMVYLEYSNFFKPAIGFKYYDRIFTTYLLYWIMGCYAGKHYDTFKSYINAHFKIVTTVFSFSVLSNAVLSLLAYKSLQWIPHLGLFHTIYSICTILFLFTVALKIPASFYEKSHLLMRIDKCSYHIYLSHCLVIYIVDKLISVCGITNVFLMFIIRFVFVYSITLTLNILYQEKIRPKLYK